MIDILKYLITLTLGLIVGYWLFSATSMEDSINKINEETPNASSVVEVIPPKPMQPGKAQVPTQIQDATLQLTQLVAKQRQTIVNLKAELAEYQKGRVLAKADDEKQSEDEVGMEILSMKDFENQLKADFTERFKGKAIEISGDQLEGIRKTYEGDTSKTEWGADFENKVVDFIGREDPNGMHYLDEVGCNKSICRLKVQSSESEQWQKIYANMTKQEWYNSMTLVEKTDDPGSFVYYIPDPNNM